MSEPTKILIINPTPKQQFVADDGRIRSHRNIMQMPQTQDSINMALLEYQRTLLGKPVVDGNSAATGGLKLAGAIEFVDILIKMGEAHIRTDSAKIATLDHKA